MHRRVVSTILIAWLVGAFPRPAGAQGPVPPAHEAHAGAVTIRYGVEFWVRASRTLNFDFDAAVDDSDDFGWNRLKPLVSVQTAKVELTLQGQDSRSYGVADLNPNGTSTYASRTSQLDFVKAYVKFTPRPGVALKIGREQADGIDVGISRKIASSSNYGTVLKSFDLVSLRLDRGRTSLFGFVADPVDNRPYALNARHAGELLWGAQVSHAQRRNTHRAYVMSRRIDANGPRSEAGARGTTATYALGVQELGPLMIPGLTWEVDALAELGHRSTDRVRAAAVFATATHQFNANHSLWIGYHQSSGDGVRGDGTTHLFDTLYSSGFNNYGYLGLSQGRNIGDLRFGGVSKLAAPLTLTWAVHDQRLSTSRDQWYAIFTPNVSRPDAPSGHLGRELDATLLVRPRWAHGSTIALGYIGYAPGRYLSTGPHAFAHQFAIDIWGQF